MRKIFILALFTFLLVSISSATWLETVYTAVLTGNQELPSSGYLPGYGTAVCVYNRNSSPKTLDCEVSHDVQSITGASIVVANPGQVGPVIYEFTVPLSPVFRQTFELQTVLTNYTVSSQEFDFLNGRWYINLSSYLFRNGEVRGQLTHNSRFYARLSYSTISAGPGANHLGVAVGSYSPFTPLRVLTLDVSHNIQNANSGQILYGVPNVAGIPFTNFKSVSSPFSTSIDLSVVESTYLLSDLTYIQINSNYPAVGLLKTIDLPPQLSYSSRLNGLNEVPPNSSPSVGCALFYYNCDTGILEYFIVHNIQNPFIARIEQLIPGDNNVVVFNLERAESPIYGSQLLTPEQQFRLINYTSNYIVNILSNSYPFGEISGPISDEWQYYAYISGTNTIPTHTTSAVGCATFSLSTNHTFSYDIIHDVPFPIGIDFGIGNVGENGEIADRFNGKNRTLSGAVQLNGSGRRALNAQNLYIQVRSSLYPSGVIRGQIYPLTQCIPVISDVVNSSSDIQFTFKLIILFTAILMSFIW